MTCYAFEGLRPVVHPTAFVHPTAVLIGDVGVGARCYVGPNASLRGDFGRLVLHPGSNLQDNCTMHSFPGRESALGPDGHVGHGAILHGCQIGRNALVGMNAVIMDNAEIGENCIVGALSLVRAGEVLPAGTLWVGSPARRVRDLSADELAWKRRGTQEYQALAQRCLSTLEPCQALAHPENDRPRLGGDYTPLSVWRGD